MITWDKIRAPFITVSAVGGCFIMAFGFFKSIDKWNDAAAEWSKATTALKELKAEVDSMKQQNKPDPRIDRLIIKVGELNHRDSLLFQAVTKHLSLTITADSMRRILMEFYEKKK